MRRFAVLLAVAAVLFAGCVEVPGAAVTPTSAPSDLLAQRRAAGIADCPSASAPAVVGGLPDLTLACLGGGSDVRLSGLRGPLLVNFWGQWCEPCRAEAPHLAAYASGQHEVALLGVDYTDPQPDWAIEFARLTGMTYPHVVDPDALTKAPLAITGVPASFLVDHSGVVVARHFGAFTSVADIRAWVGAGLGR